MFTQPSLDETALAAKILSLTRHDNRAHRLAVGAAWVMVAGGMGGLITILLRGPSGAGWGYAVASGLFLLDTAQAAPLVMLAAWLAGVGWARWALRPALLLGTAGVVPAVLIGPAVIHPASSGPTLAVPPMATLAGLGLLAVLGPAIAWIDGGTDARRAYRGFAKPGGARGPLAAIERRRGGWLLAGGTAYLLAWLVANGDAGALAPAARIGQAWTASVLLGSVQGGLASGILALATIRFFGGLERLLKAAIFRGPARLLLATTLVLGPVQALAWRPWTTNRPGVALLAAELFLAYFLPALMLFPSLPGNSRRGAMGPAVGAGLIVLGRYVESVERYAGPAAHAPGWAGALVVLGAPAAVVLLYIGALRLVPPLPLEQPVSG
ncbi:MAG: hypothetical protein ACYDAG_06660 [Chloroflexota bacterium]